MNIKCGIIGLPNVGKSTLFNILTNSSVPSKNYPFCTINPNIGTTLIPDFRLYKLQKELFYTKKNIIPANIQFIDIAGIIKNSSKGYGLGNKFLNFIQSTNALCHVVRCFKDKHVIHIEKRIDPAEDIKIIDTELILFDYMICENALKKTSNKKNKNQNLIKLTLEKALTFLNNEKKLSSVNFTLEEKTIIKNLNLLTLKPTMYVFNTDPYDDTFNIKEFLSKLNNKLNINLSKIILICAIDKQLINSIHTQINYLKLKNNILQNLNHIDTLSFSENTLLDIIYTAYDILNLQTFFTIGSKEIQAWNIHKEDTALTAANKIHTDFKKNFIRVQTISFNDFIKYKGIEGAKIAGKIRFEGKKYLIKDGDILKFLFSS